MSYRHFDWVAVCILTASVFAGSASAAVFTDATGEQFNPGDTHLDFSSVEVTNDASNLQFKINFAGNPTTPNWGKYMIGIDSVDGGTSESNGWGRPITMNGMDYWVGSWVDTTPPGAEVYNFVSNAWTRTASTNGQGVALAAPTADSSSVTISVPLALLGMENGGSFDFDVYSSGGGGGDSAIDASSNPGRAAGDWGLAYASGENVSNYVVVVPEPASLGVIGLAAAALLVRRRR
jgi:hypothetical protein